jgi:hypothetical protein
LKTFFKWLKRLILLVISLVVLAFALAFCILQWPQIILNSRTLQWGTKIAATQGVWIDWTDIGLNFKKEDLLKHQIHLQAKNLIVRTQDEAFKGVFEKVNVAFVIHLNLAGVHLTEVNPIEIDSSLVHFKSVLSKGPVEPEKRSSPPSQLAHSASSKASFGDELLPPWISHAYLSRLQIHVKNYDIWSGKDRFAGALNLESDGTSVLDILPAAAAAVSQKTTLVPAHGLAVNLDGRLSLPDRSLVNVKADLTTRVAPQIRVIDILNANVDVDYHIAGDYKLKQHQFIVKATGEIAQRKMNIHLYGDAHLKTDVIQEVHVADCFAEFSRPSDKKLPGGKINLNCPVAITLDKQIFGKDLRDKFSQKVDVSVKAELNSPQYPLATSSKLDGDLAVEVKPYRNFLINGDAKIKSKVAGILADFPKNWQLDTDILAHFQIEDFGKLVREMKDTAFAIPAPLQSLQGRIETQIEGSGNLALFQFPFKVITRLKSPEQSIQTNGKGTFGWTVDKDWNFKLKTDADLLLSDLQIMLPKLDIAALPQLTPDGRIQKQAAFKKELAAVEKPPEVKSPSTFLYHFHIHSPVGRPIRVLSNWAEKPIPIMLDLVLASDQDIQGSINIEEFPLNLFRRPAIVKHFSLNFASPMKESKLAGLIVFDYTDYKVMIELADTIEHPRIAFKSDPYQPENQVIATLFFGHPLNELDPDQASSVGDTRAAIANHAMDLASLYLLASTPIQSVNYDPTNKVVTAKVRLGNGTSLLVGGTTSELKEVGLRKHLWKNWFIQTRILNNADNSGKKVVDTYLEWTYRH